MVSVSLGLQVEKGGVLCGAVWNATERFLGTVSDGMIRCEAVDAQFLHSNEFISLVDVHLLELVTLRQLVVGIAGGTTDRFAFLCGITRRR